MRLFIGFMAGIALFAMISVLFPHQSVPRALQCGMRTADGCAIWFSPTRIERYKRGLAGSRAEFVIPTTPSDKEGGE